MIYRSFDFSCGDPTYSDKPFDDPILWHIVFLELFKLISCCRTDTPTTLCMFQQVFDFSLKVFDKNVFGSLVYLGITVDVSIISIII